MPARSDDVPLPKDWPEQTRSGFLHALALARYAVFLVRGWAANSPLERARLQGENERLRAEVALLSRELAIKDARMGRLAAARRPHYAPSERLAILLLGAARGWRMALLAERFLVTAATIAHWQKRCDEEGEDALVKPRQPVNRFPDFVAELVQELKATLPTLGKRKLAEWLARAGLHLSASTAKRLRERARPPGGFSPPSGTELKSSRPRAIVAKYPGHVWGADLTIVPLGGGLRVPWLPLFLPLSWPFCWWLLVVVDHYSRAIVHVAVFSGQPTTAEVCAAFDDAVARATGPPPKHLITDQGPQFLDVYRAWCQRCGIKPRFGALGKHGSIAVVERLIRTLKTEGLMRFLSPLGRDAMLAECELWARWYNEARPHARFRGATPAERRDQRRPATELPRFEPRLHFASPAKVCAERGVRLALDVSFLEGRAHLPLVALKRAA